MADIDVKEVVQEFGKAFEEFKKANDEKLARLEKGEAVADLDAKIGKIEEKLDSLEDINQEITKSQSAQEQVNEKLENLETFIKRPNSGFDSKQVDETLAAFDNYIRKGKQSLSEMEVKALTVSNDATGGYLAPPEYVRELLKTVTEISPIRSIARVRSTGQRSIQVPKRTGQFAAQWVSESGTRSETTGYQVGLEEIPAHEHYALVDISEQDLEDTVFDLEAEMQSEFAEQFAKAEGTAFVSGDAVGKPEGLLTNSNVSSVNSGSGTLLTADGLISLVLKDTAGQYVFQAGMSLQAGVPNTILGYPYVEATDMPDVAAGAKPILFGDFNRAYMIVDRVNLSVSRDPFTQATSGNVRYVARRRVGGQVVQAEAIVKQNISA